MLHVYHDHDQQSNQGPSEEKSDTGGLLASNTHPPTFFVAVTAATAAQPSTLQVLDADAACACGGWRWVVWKYHTEFGTPSSYNAPPPTAN